jgi:hypothetical protein
MYKNACYLGVTPLLAWAGWDQFQPFGEPASRFTSAIERSGNMEEGKIATAQLVRLKEVHQCI